MSVTSITGGSGFNQSSASFKSKKADLADASDAMVTPPKMSSTEPEGNTTTRSDSSAMVKLSAEGKSLAALNSTGIVTTQSSIANIPQPTQDTNGQLVMSPALTDAGVYAPLGPDGKPDGFITKASFESVAQQFGETIVQADQLFQALGANTDGLLSHDQFMNGIVGALKNADSAISQTIMTSMDVDGNGIVSGTEYINYETAFIAAEKPIVKS